MAQHLLLQIDIQAERDFVARLPLGAVELADDAPDGIDLHLHVARLTAQRVLAEFLHARAPDAHARQRQHRIVARIVLAGRCYVADDVGHVRAIRVVARGAGLHQHARQVGRIDLDARHIVPGQEVAQQNGNEAPAVLEVALDAGAVVVGQRHDLAEARQGRGDVAGFFGQQHGAPVQRVAGQHLAETVQDARARGRHQTRADAVALGQRGIARTLFDLHAVELHAQHAECRRLPRHDDERPAGKHGGAFAFALHGRFLMPAGYTNFR